MKNSIKKIERKNGISFELDENDNYILRDQKDPNMEVKIRKFPHQLQISNVSFKWLRLRYSSNVSITNCEFKFLGIYHCNNVAVRKCKMNSFSAQYSYDVSLMSSEVAYWIKNFYSAENTYDSQLEPRVERTPETSMEKIGQFLFALNIFSVVFLFTRFTQEPSIFYMVLGIAIAIGAFNSLLMITHYLDLKFVKNALKKDH